jgi:outer membrane protein assembly factor BamB
VVGARVFVTCYSGYGDGRGTGSPETLKRHLVCLDRATGRVLWDQAVAADLPEDSYTGYLTEHGYASSTPVSDGERVYVFFGKTGALAFDLEGRQLWKVNLGKESGNRRWGSGASPVLHKNLLIVNASEESRTVRALDTATGREVWKAEGGTLELCYSTPTVVSAASGEELLLAVPGELWGMNPDTGKLRWFASTGIGGNVSPSVVAADGVAFVTGGFPRLAAAAVRLGGKGDVTQTHVLWTGQNASYVPSPVIAGGRLFVATDTGFALCLDAKDGRQVFKERLPGAAASGRGGKPFYASAVLADGHVYAVSRRNGTFVFAAQPEFKLVAQNSLAGDDSDFNATPAIAGGQLFLRSNRQLYCIAAGPAAGARP